MLRLSTLVSISRPSSATIATAACALVAALLVTGCCCAGKSSSGSERSVSGKSSTTTVARGTIAAPPDPNGSPRRGIVRSSPDFKAAEVTRLDNGTAIAIDEKLSGGWLKIHWPYPSGGSQGYIHHDVVSQ
jgi:hypothetical protein